MSFSLCIIILAILVFAMPGCKVKGLVSKTENNYVNPEKIITINKINEERIETIWIKKIKGVYTLDEEDYKFNSNIRIIKDSIIVVSIATDFGIEAIRLYFEKDSITVLNRFHKTWYSGSIKEYKYKYGFIYDLDFLETILLMGTGENLWAGSSKQAKWHTVDSAYCYVPGMSKNNAAESFCFDNNTGYLAERKLEIPQDEIKLQIRYSGYTEKDCYILPSKINAWFSANDKNHKLLLYYDKWEVNESFPVKIKISASYKKVERLIDL